MIEAVGNLLHHRTDADSIQIGEHALAPGGEILVTDVSPAHDRYLIIDGKAFRMHPSVGASEAEQEIGGLEPAAVEGIEQPNLDVR